MTRPATEVPTATSLLGWVFFVFLVLLVFAGIVRTTACIVRDLRSISQAAP